MFDQLWKCRKKRIDLDISIRLYVTWFSASALLAAISCPVAMGGTTWRFQLRDISNCGKLRLKLLIASEWSEKEGTAKSLSTRLR